MRSKGWYAKRLFEKWETILPALGKKFQSDESFWCSGGCWLLADAVRHITGGIVVGIRAGKEWEHFYNDFGAISFDAYLGPVDSDYLACYWTERIKEETGIEPKFFIVDENNFDQIARTSRAWVPWADLDMKRIIAALKKSLKLQK